MQHFHPMIFFENIKGEKYFCINLSVTEEMSTCRLQSGVHTDLGYFCQMQHYTVESNGSNSRNNLALEELKTAVEER